MHLLSDVTLSVILPFYRKKAEFARALTANSRYLARPGIEIVLILDEPADVEEVHALCRVHEGIRWQIHAFPESHGWRNPAPVINAGIRRARGEWVLVMSPESVMERDVIGIFLDKIRSSTKDALAGSLDAFIGMVRIGGEKKIRPYGSIVLHRNLARAVRGYNEMFRFWGGEDDELRARLVFYGARIHTVREALLTHEAGPRVRKIGLRRRVLFHILPRICFSRWIGWNRRDRYAPVWDSHLPPGGFLA